jgi:hypothetical protein
VWSLKLAGNVGVEPKLPVVPNLIPLQDKGAAVDRRWC